MFPLPIERQQPINLNQTDHHTSGPSHPNYYPNRDNCISNVGPTFQQNNTIPPTCRRRSFCMSDINIETGMPAKRLHIEDNRQIAASNSTTVSLLFNFPKNY